MDSIFPIFSKSTRRVCDSPNCHLYGCLSCSQNPCMLASRNALDICMLTCWVLDVQENLHDEPPKLRGRVGPVQPDTNAFKPMQIRIGSVRNSYQAVVINCVRKQLRSEIIAGQNRRKSGLRAFRTRRLGGDGLEGSLVSNSNTKDDPSDPVHGRKQSSTARGGKARDRVLRFRATRGGLSARRKALPPDGRPYVAGPVSRYSHCVSGGGLAWGGPM